MPDLYRYSLRGRSLSIPGRVIRLTVTASNPDEARAFARLRDPDFGTTVETPRRIGRVVAEQPECYYCKRSEPILAGTYTRVDFRGSIGIRLLCDDCGAKADDRYATWQGTEVEVI